MSMAGRLQTEAQAVEVDIKAGLRGVLVLEQPAWLVRAQ